MSSRETVISALAERLAYHKARLEACSTEPDTPEQDEKTQSVCKAINCIEFAIAATPVETAKDALILGALLANELFEVKKFQNADDAEQSLQLLCRLVEYLERHAFLALDEIGLRGYGAATEPYLIRTEACK